MKTCDRCGHKAVYSISSIKAHIPKSDSFVLWTEPYADNSDICGSCLDNLKTTVEKFMVDHPVDTKESQP